MLTRYYFTNDISIKSVYAASKQTTQMKRIEYKNAKCRCEPKTMAERQRWRAKKEKKKNGYFIINIPIKRGFYEPERNSPYSSYFNCIPAIGAETEKEWEKIYNNFKWFKIQRIPNCLSGASTTRAMTIFDYSQSVHSLASTFATRQRPLSASRRNFMHCSFQVILTENERLNCRCAQFATAKSIKFKWKIYLDRSLLITAGDSAIKVTAI